MEQDKLLGTYRGDLRSALLEYSKARMKRDPRYKRAVNKMLAKRKAAAAKEQVAA